MAKGRPPKTAEQRLVEGGSQGNGAISHRPSPRPVVLAPRITQYDRPEPPTDLPPEGRELWDISVEALIDLNAAQMIDVPALRMMCRAYARAERSAQVLDKQGYFARGSTGQIVEHPAVRVYEKASNEFLRYATEFGITTLARTRLGLLDVTRRSLSEDLDVRTLGRNPRRTNRDAA